MTRWTDEECSYLTQNYRQGMPLDTLCANLKKTRGSVIGKAHRLGMCEPLSQGVEERVKDSQSRQPYLWQFTTWQYLKGRKDVGF